MTPEQEIDPTPRFDPMRLTIPIYLLFVLGLCAFTMKVAIPDPPSPAAVLRAKMCRDYLEWVKLTNERIPAFDGCSPTTGWPFTK